VRRFQLLAEDAIRNKSFEEAVDFYEQGLQVLPLWPDAQPARDQIVVWQSKIR